VAGLAAALAVDAAAVVGLVHLVAAELAAVVDPAVGLAAAAVDVALAAVAVKESMTYVDA